MLSNEERSQLLLRRMLGHHHTVLPPPQPVYHHHQYPVAPAVLPPLPIPNRTLPNNPESPLTFNDLCFAHYRLTRPAIEVLRARREAIDSLCEVVLALNQKSELMYYYCSSEDSESDDDCCSSSETDADDPAAAAAPAAAVVISSEDECIIPSSECSSSLKRRKQSKKSRKKKLSRKKKKKSIRGIGGKKACCRFPCEVISFGSTALGVDTQTSDLDVCIRADLDKFGRLNEDDMDSVLRNRCYDSNDFHCLIDPTPRSKIQDYLGRLFRALRLTRRWTGQFIHRARVPILKLCYVPYSIAVDVSVSCDDSARLRIAYIRRYTLYRNPLVRPLIVAIKSWASNHRINNAMNNYINSFGWLLCVISFLQSEKILPLIPFDRAFVKECRRRHKSVVRSHFKNQPFPEASHVACSVLRTDLLHGFYSSESGESSSWYNEYQSDYPKFERDLMSQLYARSMIHNPDPTMDDLLSDSSPDLPSSQPSSVASSSVASNSSSVSNTTLSSDSSSLLSTSVPSLTSGSRSSVELIRSPSPSEVITPITMESGFNMARLFAGFLRYMLRFNTMSLALSVSSKGGSMKKLDTYMTNKEARRNHIWITQPCTQIRMKQACDKVQSWHFPKDVLKGVVTHFNVARNVTWDTWTMMGECFEESLNILSEHLANGENCDPSAMLHLWSNLFIADHKYCQSLFHSARCIRGKLQCFVLPKMDLHRIQQHHPYQHYHYQRRHLLAAGVKNQAQHSLGRLDSTIAGMRNDDGSLTVKSAAVEQTGAHVEQSSSDVEIVRMDQQQLSEHNNDDDADRRASTIEAGRVSSDNDDDDEDEDDSSDLVILPPSKPKSVVREEEDSPMTDLSEQASQNKTKLLCPERMLGILSDHDDEAQDPSVVLPFVDSPPSQSSSSSSSSAKVTSDAHRTISSESDGSIHIHISALNTRSPAESSQCLATLNEDVVSSMSDINDHSSDSASSNSRLRCGNYYSAVAGSTADDTLSDISDCGKNSRGSSLLRCKRSSDEMERTDNNNNHNNTTLEDLSIISGDVSSSAASSAAELIKSRMVDASDLAGDCSLVSMVPPSASVSLSSLSGAVDADSSPSGTRKKRRKQGPKTSVWSRNGLESSSSLPRFAGVTSPLKKQSSPSVVKKTTKKKSSKSQKKKKQSQKAKKKKEKKKKHSSMSAMSVGTTVDSSSKRARKARLSHQNPKKKGQSHGVPSRSLGFY